MAIETSHGRIEKILQGMKCSIKTIDEVTTTLGNALLREHKDENAFDEALMQAWRDCFSDYVPAGQDSGDGFIVYTISNTRAIGFKSHVAKEALGIPEGYGGSRNNRHDHSCVVFWRAWTSNDLCIG